MSDHLPVCGRCGDLGEVGDERCHGCGKRLYEPGVKAARIRVVEAPPAAPNERWLVTAPLTRAERWLVAEGLAEATADGLVATERGLELGAGIG